MTPKAKKTAIRVLLEILIYSNFGPLSSPRADLWIIKIKKT
jgi:hypothetical protein